MNKKYDELTPAEQSNFRKIVYGLSDGIFGMKNNVPADEDLEAKFKELYRVFREFQDLLNQKLPWD
jgi:hypothetical protein